MLEILLSTQIWALHTRYLNSILPIVLSRLEQGQSIEGLLYPLATRGDNLRANQEAKRKAEFVRTFETRFDSLKTNSATGGSPQVVNVQVIKLQGPMTKNGGYCNYGSRQVAEMIQAANKNPDIGAIVVQTDSPGGAVDGTEELATAIRNSAKPIVAWVDGLAASAAYWAISQSKHIMMSSHTTAFVGSIGTLIQHIDKSGWLAKEGYNVRFLTADASTHKTLGNSFEPLSKEAEAYFKKSLNKINDKFISDVKAGRGKKLKASEAVFTGQVFAGDEALDEGLADSVGALTDAINKAAQLAISSKSNNNSPKADMKKFPFLASVFGLKEKASSGAETEVFADTEITELHAQAAEQALEQLNASLAEKEAAITASLAQIEALTAQLAERDSQITTLQAAAAEHQAAMTTLNAELEAKAAEIATLEGWRQEARVKDGRQTDELNKLSGQPQPKAEYEIEAEQKREKAMKRHSGQ